MSVYRARQLLQLEDTGTSPLRKSQIQKAYVNAAKKYHPDSRHGEPCAVKFRECHEAKRLLMDHYGKNHSYNDLHRTGTNRSKKRPWYKPTDPRAHGFPHTTLRVLTLQQNLALRGMVMVGLIVGAICDKVIFV
jgi:DnaJ domain